MPNRRKLLLGPLKVMFLLGAALILAACGSNAPATTLDPQGNHAREIYNLLIPIFWMALAVFVVVEGILIYAVLRFRQRPGAGLPPQIHGNTRIEIMWTIAPALIVLVIAVMTFRTQAINSVQPAQALQIKAIGHQWWFEFQYPDGLVTANDMYVPVGTDVTITLESVDVIHSFWMPKLAGKTDMIPNKPNRISFKAEQPGIYRGQCAEFCGESHSLMRFRVIVLPADAYQRWVSEQKTPPAAPAAAAGALGGNPANGRTLFVQKACAACHTVSGFPEAVGITGPNLTYFGSRETIAAGVLKNTPENLYKWLQNPEAIKPGNIMGTQIKEGTLTDQEIKDLVAYLESMTLTIEKPAIK